MPRELAFTKPRQVSRGRRRECARPSHAGHWSVAAETARTGKRRTNHLTDDTLRDGQQCLWATRMRTEHMLPIAERMDRAGFLSMQGIALVQFDASVLFLNQDPFERIRLLRERITRTPMRGAVRSNLMRGFFPVADGVIPLSDGAGEVIAVGAGVTEFEPGNSVVSTFHPKWLGGHMERAELNNTPGGPADGFACCGSRASRRQRR